MCCFWSIRCFCLKTQHQQHDLQSLCDKSFRPSLVSFGSVVLLPEGAQEVISQALELQQGPLSETGHGGLQGVQPRVPGAALGDERGARSLHGDPRRGPRLPRGSTTVTAAGGVGGPGALGSGRGKLVHGHEGGRGGRKSKAKGEDKKIDEKRERKRGVPGRWILKGTGMQVDVHMMALPNKPLSALVWIDKLSSLMCTLLTLPKCKALRISKHFTERSKNHVHFTDGRK